MAIDKEWAAQQYAKMKKRGKRRLFGGRDLWTPKVGQNRIRIVVPEGARMFAWESVWHFDVNGNDHQCFEPHGAECPTCVLVNDLYETGDEALAKAAKEIKAKPKIYVNIVDRVEPAKGVQIASFGPKIYGDLLALVMNPEYDENGKDITDTVVGRDITIMRAAQNSPDMYNVQPGGKPTLLHADAKQRMALVKAAVALDVEASEMEDMIPDVTAMRVKFFGDGGEAATMPAPAEAPVHYCASPGADCDELVDAEGDICAGHLEGAGGVEPAPGDEPALEADFKCVGPVEDDKGRQVTQGACEARVATDGELCLKCSAHDDEVKEWQVAEEAAKKAAAPKPAPKPAPKAVPKPAPKPAPKAVPKPAPAAPQAPRITPTAPKAVPKASPSPTSGAKLPTVTGIEYPADLTRDLRVCFARSKDEGGYDPKLDRCMVCEWDIKCISAHKMRFSSAAK